MNLLLAITEATAEEESGQGLAIILGLTMFLTLGLVLFLVTRLDPDR